MKRLVCLLAVALMATSTLAQVRVQDPWVRATVAGQKVTGAFMQLVSAQDLKLVGASSPVAGRVEIHEMVMEQDVMKMRAVPALALPAGKPVALGAGGLHIMLFDLKQEMKVHDIVPLTLTLEDRDGRRASLDVKAQVKPLNMMAQGHEHHH